MVLKKRLTGEQRALAMFVRSEWKYTLAEMAKKTKMSPSSVLRVVNGKDCKRQKGKSRKRGREDFIGLYT